MMKRYPMTAGSDLEGTSSSREGATAKQRTGRFVQFEDPGPLAITSHYPQQPLGTHRISDEALQQWVQPAMLLAGVMLIGLMMFLPELVTYFRSSHMAMHDRMLANLM